MHLVDRRKFVISRRKCSGLEAENCQKILQTTVNEVCTEKNFLFFNFFAIYVFIFIHRQSLHNFVNLSRIENNTSSLLLERECEQREKEADEPPLRTFNEFSCANYHAAKSLIEKTLGRNGRGPEQEGGNRNEIKEKSRTTMQKRDNIILAVTRTTGKIIKFTTSIEKQLTIKE